MADSGEQAQEKTQEPTAKRREDARREGQVARSRDLASFLVLSLPAVFLITFGASVGESMTAVMQGGLRIPREVALDPGAFMNHLVAVVHPLWAMLPLAIVAMLAAMLSPLGTGGLVFNPDLVGLKFDRLDPIAGLGRMFGRQAAVELAKSLLKAFWILGVQAALVIWLFQDVMALANQELQQALAGAGYIVCFGLLMMALSTALLAAIDLPYQIWEHNEKLRMSLQDLRDEHKETEGSPEVKSRLRAVAQELARRRMMDDVAKADVVVTNPTHYAVALRYVPERQSAPVVVAKGRDELALRIREVARAAGVMELRQPPLARALYFHTRLGGEIPAALYSSVAQVLAWVFQLRARGAAATPPAPLAELEVPEGMDKGREP